MLRVYTAGGKTEEGNLKSNNFVTIIRLETRLKENLRNIVHSYQMLANRWRYIFSTGNNNNKKKTQSHINHKLPFSTSKR